MGIPPLGNGGRPFSLGMKRHIDVRAESYAVAAEQAEAVRRCVVDGAAGVATTLAEPEVLKPAVREAIDAGIPVLSFSSGSLRTQAPWSASSSS